MNRTERRKDARRGSTSREADLGKGRGGDLPSAWIPPSGVVLSTIWNILGQKTKIENWLQVLIYKFHFSLHHITQSWRRMKANKTTTGKFILLFYFCFRVNNMSIYSSQISIISAFCPSKFQYVFQISPVSCAIFFVFFNKDSARGCRALTWYQVRNILARLCFAPDDSQPLGA